MKIIGIIVFILLITTATLPAILTIRIEKISPSIFRNGNTLYVGGSGPGNYSNIQDVIDNAGNEESINSFTTDLTTL